MSRPECRGKVLSIEIAGFGQGLAEQEVVQAVTVEVPGLYSTQPATAWDGDRDISEWR
jgi:hypothetical protein